jgi:hypothetical protein
MIASFDTIVQHFFAIKLHYQADIEISRSGAIGVPTLLATDYS